MKKKLILIGTDHRIQHSVTKGPNGAWVRRTSPRFRKLVTYCVHKLGAKAILEEVLPEQEEVAPTICSQVAKEFKLPWKAISTGEMNLSDALYEQPIEDYIAAGVVPIPLAGRYRLPLHKEREAIMAGLIGDSLLAFECVLTVVGYTHLAVLARDFYEKGVEVQALVFTYPLVVDESRT